MEQLISKVSRGTRLDQIYIPKNRVGFPVGGYVLVKPLRSQQPFLKPHYYGLHGLEPIKVAVAQRIFSIIDHNCQNNNIIIAGSFLERGFSFHDIDILLVREEAVNEGILKGHLEAETGCSIHLIVLPFAALVKGYSTDPLFQAMLSRCIAKKRIIPIKSKYLDFKLLDLHLLKSKPLLDNFEVLSGSEKYGMVRNAVAISIFLSSKKATLSRMNQQISALFGKNAGECIKNNTVAKSKFIPVFAKLYSSLENKILEGIAHEPKQKKDH